MVAKKVSSTGSTLGEKDEILGSFFKPELDDVLDTEILFIRNVLEI